MRVRIRFRTLRWNEAQENAAPEGRPNLAQRFSAGKSGRNDSSPGGIDRVLTHTVQRCGNCVVSVAALQAAEELRV